MLFLKVGLLIVSASAATVKIGDMAQGSQFTQCINISDFNTKSIYDDVEVVDKKEDGCCPDGYIPGIKHYKNYWGAMIICGFEDSGKVKMGHDPKRSKCTYNKCFVVKMDITCKDSSKMTLDGCCPKDQWDDECKMYTKSQTFYKTKVGYCLSYAKKYKLEGTSKTGDDFTGDATLNFTTLQTYTECAGAFGNGTSSATAASTEPAPEPAPAPSSEPAPAPASADEGSGEGLVIAGKKITCDDETYLKPTLDNFASTFENYKSCNEETQMYILEVSGYETELQAGKNGNHNSYGIGMMCAEGNMYYIYTKDTEQATFDALKASPPDESGVVLKCLIKEGSSGGGSADPATTDSAMHTASGSLALFGALMMA
jgi:hypothetical protein